MRLGLSTSALRNLEPEDIGEAIRVLAPDYVEISYHLHPEELERLLGSLSLPVASLHHPVPLPPGAEPSGEPHNPASLDPDERERAKESLLLTLETALAVGARAVVFHGGYVPVPKEDLRLMRDALVARAPGWLVLRDRLLSARAGEAPRRLDALREVIEAVLPSYEEAGVGLALENRYWPTDIPNLEEMGALLGEFPLFYWHDIGHARARALWGLEGELDSLREFGDRLLGFHVHDAKGPWDHMPPGMGELDLAAHLGAGREAILIMELSPKFSLDEIEAGLKHLRGVLAARAG